MMCVCVVMQQVLKRRDSIQMDYELVLDDLSKKEEELENVCVFVLWFESCDDGLSFRPGLLVNRTK